MALFSLLPPMPLEARIVLGLLAAGLGASLNLVYRRANPHWGQLAAAFLISVGGIYFASFGLRSGQPTDYVFLGATVGILCNPGFRATERIPRLPIRAMLILVAPIILGPSIGLLAHYRRCLHGQVAWFDDWEIGLSLYDGMTATVAGCMLGLAVILSSLDLSFDRHVAYAVRAGISLIVLAFTAVSFASGCIFLL